jgi:inner membrane protein
MDPVTHALSGAALGATGARRIAPLATAALVLGAVAPDIDAVMLFSSDFASMAHRRGITHGIAAVAVLPLAIVALLLGWDATVRRRRDPGLAPARALPLYGLAAAAVALHLSFDWINSYGIRLLMPFDGRWFYGDAVFVIDPWLWLLLGGASCVAWSARPAALAGWGLFWLLLSVPLFTSELAGASVRALWVIGLLLIIATRWRAPRGSRAAGAYGERMARLCALLTGLYIAASIAGNIPVRRHVANALTATGIPAVSAIMVGPGPTNPFRRIVVVETGTAYRTGHWDWFGSPRFRLDDELIPRNLDDPVVARAADTRAVRNFLVWSRFPYAEVSEDDTASVVVRFLDARYASADFGPRGPVIAVDRATGGAKLMQERQR